MQLRGASRAASLAAAGSAGAVFWFNTWPGPGRSRGSHLPSASPGARRAHSESPTTERASATPSSPSYLPDTEDHTLRSALSTHFSAGRRRRAAAGSAFVPPRGWQVPSRARGCTGDAVELGIPGLRSSLLAALPAAVAAVAAAAVEIVPALCRPHLSYLIHHYRIPPNRRAPQHFSPPSAEGRQAPAKQW